jgi:hypothetical protein
MDPFVMIFAIFCAGMTLADEPVEFVSGSAFRRALEQSISASSDNDTLRAITLGIERAQRVSIVLDRRLDPSRQHRPKLSPLMNGASHLCFLIADILTRRPEDLCASTLGLSFEETIRAATFSASAACTMPKTTRSSSAYPGRTSTIALHLAFLRCLLPPKPHSSRCVPRLSTTEF